MRRIGEEIHLNEKEASGGEQYNIGRWILGISLVLAVGLLSLIWIIGAVSN